ncbi:unnamed protein product [Caenorhabditis auriculariae]|uniref:EGF-like domain-containing protein n=1 Tax=Caenorhabditis auriculariae TaxID=2777116 RepID=A0A8S1HD25_9PELO|nr:unnamed protein product [Caenorhabditis auriculariae]
MLGGTAPWGCPASCSHRGNCLKQGNRLLCQCFSGYEGFDCSQKMETLSPGAAGVTTSVPQIERETLALAVVIAATTSIFLSLFVMFLHWFKERRRRQGKIRSGSRTEHREMLQLPTPSIYIQR